MFSLRLLAAVSVMVEGVMGQCGRVKQRKEFHDLTNSQKDQFNKCVRDLYDQGTWAQFEKIHADMQIDGHGNLYFLLFHRALLAEIDDALEGVGCTFGLPYLDTGSIYNHIWTDPAWDTFGEQQGCVMSGAYSGFMTGDGNCLNRYSTGQSVWASAIIKSRIDTATDFSTFSVSCENGPHAQVHQAIGGSMANLKTAAADPLFFMHHCYVDYIYATWQSGDPARKTDLGGQDPNTPAQAFGNKYTYAQLADYENGLCYTYSNPSVVLGGPAPTEGNDGDNGSNNNNNSTLAIGVPDEQLNEEIEAPPELDDEVLSSFNLDKDAAKEVHDNLAQLASKIRDMIKSGNTDQLWDVIKETIKADTGSQGDKKKSESNGSDPNAPPDSGNAGLVANLTMLMAIVAGMVFI